VNHTTNSNLLNGKSIKEEEETPLELTNHEISQSKGQYHFAQATGSKI
jgi:hypothetical protein